MDASVRTIDFDSNIPYYIQLIDVLHDHISSGDWKTGDQIPSEPDLCEAYGVSRTVVRQALRELELEGVWALERGAHVIPLDSGITWIRLTGRK